MPTDPPSLLPTDAEHAAFRESEALRVENRDLYEENAALRKKLEDVEDKLDAANALLREMHRNDYIQTHYVIGEPQWAAAWEEAKEK